MNDARGDILGRIRRAIGPLAVAREQDYATILRQYHQAGALSREERLELFKSRLEDYGCGCVQSTGAELPGTISRLLASRVRQRLIVAPGLQAEWLPTTPEWIRDEGLSYVDLDQCDGAITGCTVAIARTGSIVLCHDAHEGRRALTLIPDYHLCIVGAGQVVETVPEGLRHPRVASASLVTTISGPSATADIEMTRIKGVHGPRTLDVVIVDLVGASETRSS